MKSNELNNIITKVLEEEVKNAILSESKKGKKVIYHVTCEGEPLASFESLDEAKKWCEENKHSKELKGKKKLLIDKKTYESYDHMIDTLDEMGKQLEEKENQNMENQEPMEGNAFAYAALKAKKAGEKTFEFDGETHDVEESWKQLEEEEGMCEGAGCSGDVMETQEVCETCGCKECECGKKEAKEELKGNQTKIDKNKNGKIDAEDFKLLKKKKVEESFRPGVDLGKSFEKFKLKLKDDDEPKKTNDNHKNTMDAIDDLLGHQKKKKTNDNHKNTMDAIDSLFPMDEETSSTFSDHEEYFNKVASELDNEKDMNEGKGMCTECGSMLNEEGMCLECGGGKMYESKKKIKIRVNESELMEMISKIVMESVPGLEAVKKAHNAADNKDLDDSAKKIKDYLSFSGNTNPEFPQQVGEDKEKEAYRNSDDEQEFIDTYRGKGMHDLDYDNKPSKEFIERLRMALEGDPKMGNGQKDTANTVPSKVGSDLFKSIDKEQKIRDAEPAYKKDPAPVQDVNESVTDKSAILEEIKRMKDMSSYNKKTQ